MSSFMHKKNSFLHRLTSFTVVLLLALLLAACSDNNRVVVSDGAVSLPPIQVDTKGNIATANTITPAVTTTIAPTNTVATPTPVPTSIPQPTTSPLPSPLATPTPSGVAEVVDKDFELGLIKKSYDAINEHLYLEPDNVTILTAAIKELDSISGLTIETLDFSGTADQNWGKFSQVYNQTLDKLIADGWKYPKGDLGHRLSSVIAEAVGDGHTYFMNKDATTSRQNLLTGKNTSIGFGVITTSQDNKAYIIRVVGNGPADKAGIKAGDQLVAYDGKPLDAENWKIIRDAKENETHTFTISRSNQGQPLVIKVTKQRYNVPTVEYRLINGQIGYIAIRDFFTNVSSEVDRAMRELYAKGATAWVFDVRGNPGGVDFDQVAGRFLEGGQIMGYDSNRKDRSDVKISNEGVNGPNRGKPFTPQLPMAILIDENSASASEIVALVFRDFKLGPIIGQKSSGALGYSQSYPLGDGTSISITVREYESKGGQKVNRIGITPDVSVETTVSDLVAGRDPQLAAAVEQVEKSITAQKP